MAPSSAAACRERLGGSLWHNAPVDLRHPEALLLALPLIALTLVAARRSAAGLSAFRFRLGLGLRVFAILALALVAGEVRSVLPHRERSVVFVIDASASVGATGRRQAQDWVARAWEAHQGEDQAGVVLVGAKARSEQALGRDFVRRELDLDGLGLNRSALERGLRQAGGLLRQAPGERRVVLLSDGNASDPGAGSREARALASAGVRLDTVSIPLEPSPGEVLLGEVEAPSHVAEDEPFLLSAEIEALRAGPALLHIVRNGQYLPPRKVQLEPGLNRVTVAQRIEAADVYTYSLWIAAEGDGSDANDRGGVIVRVRGRSRILLVIGDQPTARGPVLARPLAAQLEAAGFEVVVRGPEGLPLDLEELAAFDALVFGDISADRWTTAQMEAVRRYVFEQGGGLLALGGPNSYGLGGYYQTPVEAALPLSSDVRRKKVLPSLGLVLCIDRSGSMSGEVDDTTKLELAKEGAVRCVDLLQPFDQVGVIGFGGDATWATTIRRVERRSRVKGAIRRIEASGGTNIGGALDELCDELSKVPTKLRHAVLLTDGQSGEGQGDVMRLTRRFRSARITLTTVGVGNEIDSELLEELAEGTGGRFIHAQDARTLPRLLSQEAVTASQALLIEREQQARHRGGLEELGIDWESSPPLLGYVLTDARDEAEVLLDTGGGEEAEDGPLLARWRYGLGKSAAFASDGTARWSREWLEWPGGARVFGSLVRWVARDPQAPGFSTALELSEGHGLLRVEARRPDGTPQSGLVLGASLSGPVGAATIPRLSLRETAPGHYEATTDLARAGAYFASVDQQSPSGPLAVGNAGAVLAYPREYRHLRHDAGYLAQLSEAGGGAALSVDDDPALVFSGERSVRNDYTPLLPYLIPFALALIILEVATRRLTIPEGWGRRKAGSARADAGATLSVLRDRKASEREATAALRRDRSERVKASSDRLAATSGASVSSPATPKPADSGPQPGPARPGPASPPPAPPAPAPEPEAEAEAEGKGTSMSKLLRAKRDARKRGR